MTKSHNTSLEDRASFKNWLIDVKGMTPKAAGDVVSRCKRVKRELGASFDDAFRSEDNFVSLMEMIAQYSYRTTADHIAAQRKTATLRTSVRRLLEYKSPRKVEKFTKKRLYSVAPTR
ncbi:hypothetical protein [Alcanivorax sp.]|uniref:hypothetical protein n=1 Tax=Alcanivorax sp. TaxID=1872427 RepID=UPI0023571CC4|nr:hypothetical protein [Alcanivorax sp.]